MKKKKEKRFKFILGLLFGICIGTIFGGAMFAKCYANVSSISNYEKI